MNENKLKFSRIIALGLSILIVSQMIHVSVLTVSAVRANGTNDAAVENSIAGEGSAGADSEGGVDALLQKYAEALEADTGSSVTTVETGDDTAPVFETEEESETISGNGSSEETGASSNDGRTGTNAGASGNTELGGTETGNGNTVASSVTQSENVVTASDNAAGNGISFGSDSSNEVSGTVSGPNAGTTVVRIEKSTDHRTSTFEDGNITNGGNAALGKSVTLRLDAVGFGTQTVSVNGGVIALNNLSENALQDLTLKLTATFSFNGSFSANATMSADDTFTLDLPEFLSVSTDCVVTAKTTSGNESIAMTALPLSGNSLPIKFSSAAAAGKVKNDSQAGRTITLEVTKVKLTRSAAQTYSWNLFGSNFEFNLPTGVRITRVTRVLKKEGGTIGGTDTEKGGVEYTCYFKTATGFDEAKYSDASAVKGTTAAVTGDVRLIGMGPGDYYFRETKTPDAVVSVGYDGKIDRVVTVANAVETEVVPESKEYYKVSVTKNHITDVVFIDYLGYTVETKDQNGAKAGIALTLSCNDAAAFYRKDATAGITYSAAAPYTAKWTSAVDGTVFDGELIPGNTYTLIIPGATTTDKETKFSIAVANDGVLTPSKVGTEGTATVTYDNAKKTLTVTRTTETAALQVRLVEMSSNNIPQGAVYKLYAAPAGALSAPTDYTATGYPTAKTITYSNTTGILTSEELGAGYYILMEETAPVGYKENATITTLSGNEVAKKKVYAFSVGKPTAGVIAYSDTPTKWENATKEGTAKQISYEKLPATTVSFKVTSANAGTRSGSSGSYVYTIPSENVPEMKFTLTAAGAATGTDYLSNASGVFEAPLIPGTTYTVKHTVTEDKDPYFPVPDFTIMIDGTGKFTTNLTNARHSVTVDGTGTSVKDVVVHDKDATHPNPMVDIHPSLTELHFELLINTAETIESGKQTISLSGEFAAPDGVNFSVYKSYKGVKYDSNNSFTETASPVFQGADGKAVTTGACVTSGGGVTIYGLPWRNASSADASKRYYYIQCKATSASDWSALGYPNVVTPSASNLFLVNMAKKAGDDCTVQAASSNTVLKTKNVGAPNTYSIVGQVYRGKVSFSVVDRNTSSSSTSTLSGATYDVYRLFDGTYDESDEEPDTDDYREDYKVEGSSEPYDDSADSASGVYTYKISKLIRESLVMTAYAKMAKPTRYPSSTSNDWQKIGSGITGSGTVTISGLISGQKYLVVETSAPSGYEKTSKPVVLTTKRNSSSSATDGVTLASYTDYNGSSNSSTKALTMSGSTLRWLQTSSSSASTTSKSGASNAASLKSGQTATGSGTGAAGGSGSGAGGARGAATGDDSALWFHLIVMLIAFDALAADLLYISREKKGRVKAGSRKDQQK